MCVVYMPVVSNYGMYIIRAVRRFLERGAFLGRRCCAATHAARSADVGGYDFFTPAPRMETNLKIRECLVAIWKY